MFLVLLQIMFVVYMILVTLLLVNMLIAMMGNTYHMVNEAQGEWLRQVRYRSHVRHLAFLHLKFIIVLVRMHVQRLCINEP